MNLFPHFFVLAFVKDKGENGFDGEVGHVFLSYFWSKAGTLQKNKIILLK